MNIVTKDGRFIVDEPGKIMAGDPRRSYTRIRVEGYPFVEKALALAAILNGYDELVEEVARLRNELGAALDHAANVSEFAHHQEVRAEDLRREAQRERDDAVQREWAREDAVRQLDRARRMGNEYEERRAMDKLKRGW